jgi:glycerol-3-phosphate dehydrogenase (NAD(P)+)
MSNVCIVGDGGWGTALALVLLQNGHRVTVWGPFPDYIQEVCRKRQNEAYLPGVPLPPEIAWTADRDEAAGGAEVAVLAVPTRFFRAVAESFVGRFAPGCRLVSVAKGLDQTTHERMTQVAARFFPAAPIAALSGPSHAEEVARGIPTAVVAASADAEAAAAMQRLFSNRRFRVYTSADVVGVELGGALKNVIAIAAGVSDGIGFGDNAKAALATRGLVEITRLGVALGARPATFAGLSGVGDLIVTCFSRFSRNRAVGERLGRGESIDGILNAMKQVAEGVWNCTTACELARQTGQPAPIAEEVRAMIREGKDPHAVVESLMTRDMKSE